MMIDWKKKLQNPFALVAEGFVAGVILFWATAPRESIAAEPTSAIAAPAGELTR